MSTITKADIDTMISRARAILAKANPDDPHLDERAGLAVYQGIRNARLRKAMDSRLREKALEERRAEHIEAVGNTVVLDHLRAKEAAQ